MKKLTLPLIAAAAMFVAVGAANAESILAEVIGVNLEKRMLVLKGGMQMMIPESMMKDIKVGDKVAVEFEKMGDTMMAYNIIKLGPR